MNTCGFEKGITDEFTDEDPMILEQEYMFSEWYFIVKDLIFTPNSFIMEYEDLFNGEIDSLINTLPGKQCFARLDTLSSKPSKPYISSKGIRKDFISSNRTNSYFNKDMKIIIREWIDLKSFELRCFIHDRKLRAISSEMEIFNVNEIIKAVDKITFYTEYDSYCVDFTYHDDKLMLIEINTPVWMFGCSGLFDLDVPFDLEVLLGEYIPDIIDYPVIKVSKE